MFPELTNERQEWEQRDDESTASFAKFEQYRDLGPMRTKIAAYRLYLGDKLKGPVPEKIDIPTGYKKLFERFEWKARAEAFDNAERQERDRFRKIERDRILSEGFAVDYRRVEILNELAQRLTDYFKDGCFDERRMRQLRGLLDDLAAETGGRTKRQELTGADGAPLNTVVILPSNERDTAKN